MADLDKEIAVFEAAIEHNKAEIERLPYGNPERDAYIAGLADGVKFTFNRA